MFSPLCLRPTFRVFISYLRSSSCPCNWHHTDSKASACNAGHLGSIPESKRSPGKGNGNHFSILTWRIPKSRGVWRATVNGVAKSRRTWLSDFHFHFAIPLRETISVPQRSSLWSSAEQPYLSTFWLLKKNKHTYFISCLQHPLDLNNWVPLTSRF